MEVDARRGRSPSRPPAINRTLPLSEPSGKQPGRASRRLTEPSTTPIVEPKTRDGCESGDACVPEVVVFGFGREGEAGSSYVAAGGGVAAIK